MSYADYKAIPCPNCGEKCYTEWVDVGVGKIQADPYHCEYCGWVEVGCPAEKCSHICQSYDFCKGKAKGDGNSDIPPELNELF